MASPQTENGFTRIANEILEAVQMYKFTLNELKIVLCIWRYTYGFQRKSHQLSLTFIMNHTGLGRTRINDSIKRLIESNVIKKMEQGRANSTNSYMFNKHYNSWKIEKYASFGSVQNDTSVQIDTSVRNDTDTSVQFATNTSVQNDTSTSVQDDTQERKVKESIKENIKDNRPSTVVIDNSFGEIVNFYEMNVGPITPHIGETLGEFVDEYSSALTLYALKRAVESKPRNLVSYTQGILRKWKSSNLKTIEQVDSHENNRVPYSNTQGQSQQSVFSASPETLERQRRDAEKYKDVVIDDSDLPF
ncbi:replication protein [Sporosarcina jiandibaonis]|uniref:replication protein n=1 Tax=Sporosarcina jiandibaonis TaxID=2715535 RepID=UPI001553760E|nr:replication protein [Sporosarcina jiandibaonis]